jgi:broad specificity phosphatase PhoE
MTRFLLIRHGDHALLGRQVIAGRQPGISLSDLGREQATNIANDLATLPIDAVYSSPLERAIETASPLAAKLGLEPQIAEEFHEIEFGSWTNRTLTELDQIPEWKHWNGNRSMAFTPAGDSMLAVQTRALKKMSDIAISHEMVAIFTHGDVIRALLAHFLGTSLDLFYRIEIDPASISVVEQVAQSFQVRCVNESGATVASIFRLSAMEC